MEDRSLSTLSFLIKIHHTNAVIHVYIVSTLWVSLAMASSLKTTPCTQLLVIENPHHSTMDGLTENHPLYNYMTCTTEWTVGNDQIMYSYTQVHHIILFFIPKFDQWVITNCTPLPYGSRTNLNGVKISISAECCVIIESKNFLLILLSLHGIYYPH